MQKLTQRIPVTLFCGYLGAGKTTAINVFLSEVRDRRVAVLVNDFGAINVDAALIRGQTDQTISLTNGCVCCTISDDLGDALDVQLARTEPPEQILVEASGVSETPRLARHIAGWPGIELNSVVCIVDAKTVMARGRDKYTGGLVLRQLAAADLIVLNKSDLVGELELRTLHAWLETLAPAREVLQTSRGRIDPQVLLAPRRTGVSTAPAFEPRPMQAFHPAVALWEAEAPVDLERLAAVLQTLASSIHRAKGMIRPNAETGRRVLVQWTDGQLEMSSVPEYTQGSASSAPGGYLVMIGRNTRTLDHARQLLQGCTARAA